MSLAQAPPETGVLDVSVVLPCYNERDHVELKVKRMRAALAAAGMSYELICVDDGSTDGTRGVLEAIAGIRAILLRWWSTIPRGSSGRQWPPAQRKPRPWATSVAGGWAGSSTRSATNGRSARRSEIGRRARRRRIAGRDRLC